MSDFDLNFYFDPVCPFAWMTSKWVRMVAAQREYKVDWRFISLRMINADVDYDSHFPPGYESGHQAGLRMLRVAARARAEHGRGCLGPLYAAMGAKVFDSAPRISDDRTDYTASRAYVEPILAEAGLPLELADALEDSAFDPEIRAETDEALALTGKDVGTPILPREDQAVGLWDNVVGLASFAGFAELKRSLRELPQLRALGVEPDEVGVQEDWHGGSRRQKK
jgi:mycothiol-dependent nitroreductase-like protein